jgi:hypothetical protein
MAEPTADIHALFAKAEAEGRVGVARKTKLVDARAARSGEVVVTIIAGEGRETQSAPAETGDMVVRNRCPETGNEEILVKAKTFSERYEGPAGLADGDGWATYRPRGNAMTFYIVTSVEGSFSFTAPWGEAMVAKPGDAIVRDPKNPRDTYRIARAAFECTYEVVEAPRTPQP